MIEVNGNEILLQETNLETLLEKLGYRRERVAVELNGRIVKRDKRGRRMGLERCRIITGEFTILGMRDCQHWHNVAHAHTHSDRKSVV